jgi:CBS domain-containing protein
MDKNTRFGRGKTMLMVRHVMLKNVVTTNPKISLRAAIEILNEKHIGSLLITDSHKKCIGIFTERDVIRVVAQGVNLDDPIKKVMTSNVITLGEEASLEEARRLIITHAVRHFPVVNGQGKLVGLLSVRKLLDEFFGLQSSKYC